MPLPNAIQHNSTIGWSVATSVQSAPCSGPRFRRRIEPDAALFAIHSSAVRQPSKRR